MPNLNNPRLVLTPVDASVEIDEINSLIADLMQLKFIDQERSVEKNLRCYNMGENFLHQITFLGCSPTLISADSSDKEIFISIGQHSAIQFSHSSEIPPPRCPHCQKADKNWQTYYSNWQQDNSVTETCPQCLQNFLFTEMKWKKNGGYGKLLIQIHGIQEHLAIPNPSFIDALQTLTKMQWHYFFADN